MEEVKKQGTESPFCPSELALRMKALGFDEPCLAFHSKIYGLLTSAPTKNVNEIAGECLAPTFSQAFRWFREKYGFVHTIFPADLSLHEQKKTDYACGLYLNDPIEIIQIKKRFSNYYNAELACLEKLIEIVESKSE